MEPCTPDHPQLGLLFALEGAPTAERSAIVRAWAARLPTVRAWSIPVPALVDEFDSEETHTLGVFTRLLSAQPPWRERIPLAVDRAQYEDVCALVEAVQVLSVAVDDDVIIEFDGDAIGWVRRGVPTPEVATGLLDDWRRGLERKTREVLQAGFAMVGGGRPA